MKNNGESGHSEMVVNYGIMEETKKCIECGYVHSVDNFYYDNYNKRYETYCKSCKTDKVKKRRVEDETYKLRQEIYNLRYQLKIAREKK